jgi:hypothetical protein
MVLRALAPDVLLIEASGREEKDGKVSGDSEVVAVCVE